MKLKLLEEESQNLKVEESEIDKNEQTYEQNYNTVEARINDNDWMSEAKRRIAEKQAEKQAELRNPSGGRNSLRGKIVKKIIRKHSGIVQNGGNKGRLRKGYKFSGQKLKGGLPQIVKCVIKI